MENKETLKILFTTSSFPRWKDDSDGIFIWRLANTLSKHNNIKISILAPHYPQTPTQEKINNITIFRFRYFLVNLEKLCYEGGILTNIKKKPWTVFLLFFFAISQIFYINKIVKKEKTKIIHAHWLIPQGLIAVIYKKIFNKKIKIICTIHGSDIFGLQNKIMKIIKKYTIKNIDKIITVSHALQREIIKYPFATYKTTVIYNPIDIKKFKPNGNIQTLKNKYQINSFCLLYVGRLIQEKGIEKLINAMPYIIEKYPKTKLLVIGNGHQLSYLKKTTCHLKIEGNVMFLGKIPNNKLPDFYSLADLMINPSESEGLSTVCLESLACATPVIAHQVGGMPEIIKNNYTGLLIKDNSPQTIAQAVLKLLSNNSFRKQIGKNGRLFFKKTFNPTQISQQYCQEYRKIAKKHV